MLKFDNKILTDENYDEYEQYLESIKPRLPKMLVKYYEDPYGGMPWNNRFHDAVIISIELKGRDNFYLDLGDAISIKLDMGRESEYHIEFEKILRFECKYNIINNQYDPPTKFKQDRHKTIFGEIISCLLDVTPENYVFQFNTSTNMEVFIEFQKVHIKKIKIR